MFPKRIVIFVVIITLSVIASILVWTSLENYDDFRDNLFQSGVSYLERVRKDIYSDIQIKKNQMQTVIDNKKVLINRIITDNKQADFEQLVQYVSTVFPTNQGLTIVSSNGKPLIGSDISAIKTLELNDLNNSLSEAIKPYNYFPIVWGCILIF